MEVNLGWMQNPDWIFEKMDRKSAENHFNQKKIGKNMNWAESGSMAARGIGIEPSNWAESGTMAANVLKSLKVSKKAQLSLRVSFKSRS